MTQAMPKPGTDGRQVILAFVKKQGKATSAEIAGHWQAQGLTGMPFLAVAQLVRAGKLKKTGVADGKGVFKV
jgi:hypothetical protein